MISERFHMFTSGQSTLSVASRQQEGLFPVSCKRAADRLQPEGNVIPIPCNRSLLGDISNGGEHSVITTPDSVHPAAVVHDYPENSVRESPRWAATAWSAIEKTP